MILSKKRITKALIILRGCASWPAPLMFPNPKDRFSRVKAHLRHLSSNEHNNKCFHGPIRKYQHKVSFKGYDTLEMFCGGNMHVHYRVNMNDTYSNGPQRHDWQDSCRRSLDIATN